MRPKLNMEKIAKGLGAKLPDDRQKLRRLLSEWKQAVKKLEACTNDYYGDDEVARQDHSSHTQGRASQLADCVAELEDLLLSEPVVPEKPLKPTAYKAITQLGPKKAVTGVLPNMEQVWKIRIPAVFLHMLAKLEGPITGEFSYTTEGGNTVTAMIAPIDGNRVCWDFYMLEPD